MENAGKMIAGLVIAILIVCGMWFVTQSQSFNRFTHTLEGEYGGGLHREVIVYDMNGEEVQHFEGTFMVKETKDRIIFDDANTGQRHVVYFKTGTVVVNELD